MWCDALMGTWWLKVKDEFHLQNNGVYEGITSFIKLVPSRNTRLSSSNWNYLWRRGWYQQQKNNTTTQAAQVDVYKGWNYRNWICRLQTSGMLRTITTSTNGVFSGITGPIFLVINIYLRIYLLWVRVSTW